MHKSKKKLNISKLLAQISMLLILACTQVNALPLSQTFGEKHKATFVYQDGETYLKLGHEHSHQHHHHEVSHHHTHNTATTFNGHDGTHTDHFIKITDSKIDALISTKTIENFNPSTYQLIIDKTYFLQIPKLEDHKIGIADKLHRTDQSSILRKHCIQILV